MSCAPAAVTVAAMLAAAALAGCAAPEPPRLGQARQASEVDDYLTSTCSTSVVLGLSQQILDEMACLIPGELATFAEQGNIVFGGAAVLPYLSPQGVADLQAAAASDPDTDLIINSAFRSVVQQYLLRAWFDLGRCGITAAAQPGSSNHESARAIDVDNWPTWKATLEANGWAQTVPGDEVHFDHLASTDLRGLDVEAFQRLWNRNHPDDQIAEDGDYGPQTAARIAMAPAEGFELGAMCDPPSERAVEVVARTGPTSLPAGGRGELTLTLANVGTVAWGAGTRVELAPGDTVELYEDDTWVDPDTLAILDEEVAPGDQVVLAFAVDAPVIVETLAVVDTFVLDDGGERFGLIAVTETIVGTGGEDDSGCRAGHATSAPGGVVLGLLAVGWARRRRAGRARNRT
jgi:hypothetical protein